MPYGFEASTVYNCCLTQNGPFGTTSSIEVNTSSTSMNDFLAIYSHTVFSILACLTGSSINISALI